MRSRRGIPLGIVLLIGFVGLVTASTGSILVISTWSGGQSAHELMLQRSAAVLHGLEHWLRRQLDPLEALATGVQTMVADGTLDLDDAARVTATVQGLLAATPHLEGVALVTPDHRARRYGRDGLPRLEDWTQRTSVSALVDDMLAQAADGPTAPVWGAPVWRPAAGQAALHVRVVLTQDDTPRAVLFAMVGLDSIASALPTLLSGGVLTPYVLFGDNHVLAHPLLEAGAVPAETAESGSGAPRGLPDLADFPDPHLAPLWTARTIDLRGPIDLEPGWARGLDLPEGEVIHTLRHVDSRTPHPLLVGTHFTARSGATPYVRLWESATVGLVVLVLAVVAALLLARWIGAPVLRFAALARAVAAGDLSHDLPPSRSLIREYREGSEALQGMVEGLRERERIRSLFGKYVPEEVARRLLAQDGEARPEETEATILFADLTDFTHLTRILGPERVVRLLNAYFSEMVAILEDHGGVVTQFQGDAMLVVFNLPEPHPDHATAAVRAALTMQQCLDRMTFEGQSLRVRIGIGTGTVLAGAVGAKDRLSYTVHGDAVNLAARLEVMNKSAGTRILVSDRTATLAGALSFVSLGKLPVRGQEVDARVYTPAHDGRAVPEALDPETAAPKRW